MATRSMNKNAKRWRYALVAALFLVLSFMASITLASNAWVFSLLFGGVSLIASARAIANSTGGCRLASRVISIVAALIIIIVVSARLG